MFNLIPQVFRNAEGEGAGGGSDVSGEGASPAPDKVSDLEARLDRITKSVDDSNRQQTIQRERNVLLGQATDLEAAKNTAKAAIDVAQKTLADAFDNGEGAEIAKAQRTMTEAVAQHERADLRLETAEHRHGHGG